MMPNTSDEMIEVKELLIAKGEREFAGWFVFRRNTICDWRDESAIAARVIDIISEQQRN